MPRLPALAVLALLAACATPPPPARFEARAMGTSWTLLVDAPHLAPRVVADAAEAAFERVAAIDARFSDYRDDSEASRLGRALDAGQPVTTSGEMDALLHAARDAWAASDGAFDVTVGALTQLWRRAARQDERPPAEELAGALAASGSAHVTLGPRTMRSDVTGLRLDFGAIAKGHALDEALAVLAERGITRALVDGGGDLAIGDPPTGRDGWRVEIADPIGAGSPPLRRVLSNCGVATSGDLSRGFELDGVRYGHLIDPRTGEALTPPRGATVFASDARTADVWASALTVLGAADAHLAPADVTYRVVTLVDDEVVVDSGP